MTQPLLLTTPARNLVRLTIARGITWTCFLVVILFGIEVMNFKLRIVPIIAIIVAMGLFNVATWWRLGQTRQVTDIEYLIHLLIDVTGLTLIFYYTGGATNPAITYYLIPVAMAAATQPWRHACITAASAFLAYSMLMVFFEPVPELRHTIGDSLLTLNVLGMWLNFALCAGLITFVIFRMADTLRQRDRMLSHTREAALRNEQILAVASQAAGTAHELGTPLSTMIMLIEEMKSEPVTDTQRADLDLLRSQVDTCKRHLRELVASAERRQSDPPARVNAADWLETLIQRWLVMRPDVTHTIDIEHRAIPLMADPTLDQAIMNLLNNAADANPQDIAISLSESSFKEDTRRIVISIVDHGPGISMEIARRMGEGFISGQSRGLGIGLFLTHSTLDRFGGSVSLYNQTEGGTLTEVRLPHPDANPAVPASMSQE
ncbi:two-component system, sensor histidine kinase RegB [Kushneria avicenniae]|uniref:histidine kinase n=1 Tax=Kushneria avicenniae TaxID=402385 RepID=A0A1I1FGA7_9GAMM|nr:ATP-binding protein [Kushneria avicenniae]SFB97986.1 two-component system, sensor histidine kinase RegB [Kushneria avicenniae]